VALLAAQQININGLQPTFVAASASDTVACDDRVIVIYLNTDAATRTITLVTPPKLNQFGQDLGNVVVTIAALTGREVIGPITNDFDGGGGVATITLSATANVTVAAVRI